MTQGSRRPYRVLALGLGLALALGFGLVLGPARAGDPVTAKSLLGSAKDALEQKKYDTALNLLAKARAEDAELIEIGYWEAFTQEKKGDLPTALRQYRAFREVAGLAQARNALTKELQDLQKKTQARIAVLAPGEAEDQRLRASLATELLALAKSREAKDRAAAALALEALLVADPGHAEAQQALALVTLLPPRKGEFPLPEELRRVGPWNDMIAKTPFGTIATWQYVDPGLVIEGDASIGAAEPILLGEEYALDLEVRIAAVRAPKWAVGWILYSDRQTISFTFMDNVALGLAGTKDSSSHDVLYRREVPQLQPGVWHRLTVLVQKQKVKMWVDGDKGGTFTAESLGTRSQLAFIYNGLKFELRTFRWAVVR